MRGYAQRYCGDDTQYAERAAVMSSPRLSAPNIYARHTIRTHPRASCAYAAFAAVTSPVVPRRYADVSRHILQIRRTNAMATLRALYFDLTPFSPAAKRSAAVAARLLMARVICFHAAP